MKTVEEVLKELESYARPHSNGPADTRMDLARNVLRLIKAFREEKKLADDLARELGERRWGHSYSRGHDDDCAECKREEQAKDVLRRHEEARSLAILEGRE